MTKNGLEYDQKNSHGWTWTLELDRKITPTNLNSEHDRNMDEYDQKFINRKNQLTHELLLSEFPHADHYLPSTFAGRPYYYSFNV